MHICPDSPTFRHSAITSHQTQGHSETQIIRLCVPRTFAQEEGTKAWACQNGFANRGFSSAKEAKAALHGSSSAAGANGEEATWTADHWQERGEREDRDTSYGLSQAGSGHL